MISGRLRNLAHSASALAFCPNAPNWMRQVPDVEAAGRTALAAGVAGVVCAACAKGRTGSYRAAAASDDEGIGIAALMGGFASAIAGAVALPRSAEPISLARVADDL